MQGICIQFSSPRGDGNHIVHSHAVHYFKVFNLVPWEGMETGKNSINITISNVFNLVPREGTEK